MEQRIRVLIADNSAVIRRLVAEALHIDPDFEVYPAIHGRDAIDQISHIHPDLVVLDVELPVLDGVEAVREIRRTNRKLPIIMLCKSSDAHCEATLAALAAGANDFVTKAIRIGHVGAAIQYIRSQLIPKIRYWTQPQLEQWEPFESDANHGTEHARAAAHLTATAAVGSPRDESRVLGTDHH
jgi:two-component system, chemotaxis family, protein-glutamate methylesterase/glutaminase